jgi:hypothetical protein
VRSDKITLSDFGLKSKDLWDLSAAPIDWRIVHLVFKLPTEEDTRTLFSSLGMGKGPAANSTDVHMVRLYLKLAGLAKYELGKNGCVDYHCPIEKVIELGRPLDGSEVTTQLMRILDIRKSIAPIFRPACDILANCNYAIETRGILMRIHMGTGEVLRRADYGEFTELLDIEVLSSSRTRVELNRERVFRAMDFLRYQVNHNYLDKSDDLKYTILGSETRRRKVTKMVPFKVPNLNLISRGGQAIAYALNLRVRDMKKA